MLQIMLSREQLNSTDTWIAVKDFAKKAPGEVAIHVTDPIGVGATRTGALSALREGGNGHRNGRRNVHRNATTPAQPSGVSATAVLELIRANPGITAAEIRQRAPITPGMLGSVLQRLAKAGSLRATGKRGMRHYRLADTQQNATA